MSCISAGCGLGARETFVPVCCLQRFAHWQLLTVKCFQDWSLGALQLSHRYQNTECFQDWALGALQLGHIYQSTECFQDWALGALQLSHRYQSTALAMNYNT